MTVPASKEFLHLLDYMIPIKLACNSEQDIIWLIASLPECQQILALQLIDFLCRAKYGATKGSAFIEIGAYKFEDTAHGFIIAAANLLQYDIAHLLQLFVWKGWCEQEFIHEFERRIEFSVDDLRKH